MGEGSKVEILWRSGKPHADIECLLRTGELYEGNAFRLASRAILRDVNLEGRGGCVRKMQPRNMSWGRGRGE